MKLKHFMKLSKYRITEGSEYQWNCYGTDAYNLDYWNGDNNRGYGISIVFDTKKHIVFEMNFCDYRTDKAYRHINPNFFDLYLEECKRRGFKYNKAFDECMYEDLPEKKFLKTVRSIIKEIENEV